MKHNHRIGSLHFWAVLLACGSALLASAGTAHCDTLITLSGARFEGKVEVDGEWYLVTTPNGGHMRFPKTAVREVRASAPSVKTPQGSAGTVPAKPQVVPSASQGASYLLIPVVGEIGAEVLAADIEKVLAWASQGSSAKHIVFCIKSPGGTVDEAEKIVSVMEKYHPKFTYHAYVEQAISAAIWPAFACDKIWMGDGGAFGGAVAFHFNKTGTVEVDAKMNSILASQVASLAQKNGHSGIIAKAMIVMGERAYVWLDGQQKPQIADALPAGISESALIIRDTETTILTLTKEQAVRADIAGELRGGPPGIGAALGLSGWHKASDYGENVMSRAKSNREKEEAKLQAAIKQNVELTRATILLINQNYGEALRNDLSNFTYSYDITTGVYTPDSLMRWAIQTERAIAAWQRVRSGVVTLQGLEKQADKLGLARVTYDLNLAQVFAEASREIVRLSRDRARSGP